MPSAEIQRIVLLIALGVLGYLLVYAWNQDYGRSAGKSTPDVAPVVEDGGRPSVPQRPLTDDLPVRPVTDDVPGEEFFGTERVRVGERDADDSRLVHVRTPTLEAWIDRLGGDIVGLRLPQYLADLDGDVPVHLLDRRKDHVYIAQSGLIGRDGWDKAGSRPLYTASASDYAVDEGTVQVTLRRQADGVTLRKRFLFSAKDYVVTVEHEIDNGATAEFRVQLFAQLKRDATRPEASEGFGMGPRPYVGAAFTTADSRYEKIDFDDLDDGPFRTEVRGGWAAMLQHYFLTAWVGDRDEVNTYNGRRLGDGNYAVGYVGPEIVVAPGQRGTASARFYAGPKIQKLLDGVAPNLYLTVDYGLLWWLSVPLFYVLDGIHSAVGNWGLAIILLTLGVKLLLYPLASAGFRSMARMKKVAPQVKRLQERHAGDRQKLSQEMMALYRKEGANPFSGCLPLLLQMPVFFALYWVLYESVELRHAPFALWIEDLAAPDPFFVLPLLYGASFFAMQLLHPPPPDPMQARVMKAMPILFTVLFVFFPAGLVLYWLVNNVLSLAQQWFVTRQIERASATA